MSPPILTTIEGFAAELTQLRRQLHSMPELAFQEINTAQAIEQQLHQWGIQTFNAIGGTGVVAVIQKGHSHKTVALRADMDALPIVEDNQFAHASKNLGVMHACGHDGHCAMLLGAAKYLHQYANFAGSIYLVFQPAEENAGGAKKMLADGLLTRFPIQAIFALHNVPHIPLGYVACSGGAVLASNSEFKISLTGSGGHAAMPHLCTNPIPVASQLINALNSMVAHSISPFETAVVSVTNIHAGETSNIIPDQCTIGGTIRTFAENTLTTITNQIQLLANSIAKLNQATAKVVITHNYPPTINPPPEAEFMLHAASQIVGLERTLAQLPIMAAEDFAFYLQHIPGSYAFIGNGDGSHRAAGHSQLACSLHGAGYDFNDEIIPIGAATLAQVALNWLKQQEDATK